MTENNGISREQENIVLSESDAAVDNRGELNKAGTPPARVRPLWHGVLVWLAVCVAYVGIGMAGFIELWFITPFVFALVVSQVLETRMWTRFFIGIVAIFLALLTVVLGILILVWREAWLPDEPSTYTIAIFLIVLGSLVLPCLVRGARARLFSVIGLNQDSTLHTTASVMFVLTVVSCGGIFVLLLEDPGETIFLDLKDPIISLLSDVPLALAGVGLMLRRDFKQSIERLGFVSMKWREFGWAVVVTLPFILVVLLFDSAEELLLPEIHALEDRFPMEFRNVSAIFGIPAISLAAGLGEEAVFRGALQPRFGIVLTALLFAAVHVQYQLPGIFLIFIIGIFLGVLRKRKSTTFTACVHMVYDVIALSLPDF
jgi:membrane protease YdiL (CAAX protease family)